MRRTLSFLLLYLFLLPGMSAAQEQSVPSRTNFNYDAFSRIPVLHEGRVKPLDSFAHIHLKTFSGRESLPGISAEEWLAETLFNPAEAVHRPLFHIRNPMLIGLQQTKRQKNLYSYAELAQSMSGQIPLIEQILTQDPKQWTPDQKNLITLHENSFLYTQLLRTLSMVLPLNLEPPESLRRKWNIPEGKALTLNEFSRYEERLKTRLKTLIADKGGNPENYTPEEREIAAFAYGIGLLRAAGSDNIFFRIVPAQWPGEEEGEKETNEEWLSPWALTQTGQGGPQSADYMRDWTAMAAAWQTGNAKDWQQASGAALNAVLAMPAARNIAWRLDLEVIQNKMHLTDAAMILYLLAFLLLAAAAMTGKPRLKTASLTALSTGAAAHMVAICLRVLILERPPVGTLYESALFVSLICVISAVILERRHKDGTGLLSGSIGGLLLLAAAAAFAEGDTMPVLTAVLNTNFWLTIHVLCITIGYGWCVAAAMLSHIALFRNAFGKPGEKKLETSIQTAAIGALLFTTVGTILGGLWADQSWGRFWGWDPKENGALLIVLWLIWLLHGKIGGQLNKTAFLSGMAFLNVIVALAWFGVNLLSIGLHSYGFTTGIFAGLSAFCATETILIAALWIIIRKHNPA